MRRKLGGSRFATPPSGGIGGRTTMVVVIVLAIFCAQHAETTVGSLNDLAEVAERDQDLGQVSEIQADPDNEQVSVDSEEEELSPVPESVTCYHKIVENSDSEQTLFENFIDEANIAMVKLNHTTSISTMALGRSKELESDVAKEKAVLDEHQAKYKKEHFSALNVYELARVALNKYNDLRKEASTDDTRSAEAMTAYLKYKDLMLKAKDDAEAAGVDPNDSQDFKQYEEMSNRYLGQYKGLQTGIKEKLAESNVQNTKYQELSAKYKKVGEDLKLTDEELIKAQKVWEAVDHKYQLQQAKYEHAVSESEEARKEQLEKHAKAMLHKEKWESLKADAKRVHEKYNVFNDKVKQLGQLKVDTVQKLVKFRKMVFKFTEGSKEAARLAEESMKKKDEFREKYEVAEMAQKVFSEAYSNGGCGMMPHQVEAKKERARALTKAKQDVEQAVNVADEELLAAQEMRDEADAEEEKKTLRTEDADLRESQYDVGDAVIPATEKVKPEVKLFRSAYDNILSHAPSFMKIEKGSGVGSYTLPQAADRGSSRRLLKETEETQETPSVPAAQKTLCEHDREIGTVDWHASKHSKELMEMHQKKEADQRKKSASMMSGAESAKHVLKSVQLKLKETSSSVERAMQLRSEPCGPGSAEEDWAGNMGSEGVKN